MSLLAPVYMEWGTPVYWRRFLLLRVPQSVKTKETNPTRPGSPTPCKQAVNLICFVFSMEVPVELNPFCFFVLFCFVFFHKLCVHMQVNKGLFTWRWGTPGR